jgi:hypothetical protein
MAKDKAGRAPKPVTLEVTLEGPDAAWARSVERVAKEQGNPLDQAIRDALRDWLWQASGLKRMFEQVRESGELMTRSFQVEGMLLNLAKSGGISLGQQSDYLKRAQEEREQFTEQRKKIARLVRDIRRVADASGLPDAIQAAEKLIVPD